MAPKAGSDAYLTWATQNLGTEVAQNASIAIGDEMVKLTALNDTVHDYMSGRRDHDIEFEMLVDPSDAAFAAVMTSFNAKTTAAINIGPASNYYWSGTARVQSITNSTNGEGAATFKVKAKGCGAFTPHTS